MPAIPPLKVDARLSSAFTSVMRYLAFMIISAWCVAGCASRRPSESEIQKPRPAAPTPPKPATKSVQTHPPTPPAPNATLQLFSVTNQGAIVTLTQTPNGKIAAVNLALRFVVVDFSLGPMPGLDQRMTVYRQGLRVGELKITGPERNGNTAADLIAGEAQTGDDVRLENAPNRTDPGP
jgi:hypothetical protein